MAQTVAAANSTPLKCLPLGDRTYYMRSVMDKRWQKIAERIVQGLGVQPGELINVRDRSGCLNILLEISLAIERVGATPLFQLLPGDYLERLWTEAPRDYLAHWDQHRREWVKQIDRVLVLAGARPDFSLAPKDAFDALRQAQYRLTVIEEERRLPYLLVAIPTERGAQQLGLAREELEEILLPALGASVEELQNEIGRVLNKVSGGRAITIHSGDNHVLHLEHGDRIWLSDDGCIDEMDLRQGAIASNLPAGSIYTTVVEEKTHGSLWLPRAGEAIDVVFHFSTGCIVDIEAASGADLLIRELDSHTGEPRRVSHIGLGLNPYLKKPAGWTIIDEHIHGYLFIALGENRYMGGQNESSLNVDYALADVTLKVDGHIIVSKGKVII
jgi:leucyl aminopeptidase (aminopeptidase T)